MVETRWPVTKVCCPNCGHNLTSDLQTFEGVTFEFGKRPLATFNGHKLPLPALPTTMLHILLKSKGRVISRDFLYDSIYWEHSGDGPSLKVFDVVMCKIRKVLREAKVPIEIETHWGRGYRAIGVENVPQ